MRERGRERERERELLDLKEAQKPDNKLPLHPVICFLFSFRILLEKCSSKQNRLVKTESEGTDIFLEVHSDM
jgi:hypothetical protein